MPAAKPQTPVQPKNPPAIKTSDLDSSSVAPDRVSHIAVGVESDGQRLDNFLLRIAKGVPKSHVYRIVRSGEVRVNGARATVERRLQQGDVLRIPPLRTATINRQPVVRAAMPPVLFEDEHLIVVDKPAGLAAHGGSGIAHGLIEQVRAARAQQPFLELAHRLDRETSGVLLLAKTRKALVRLHDMLREGEVDKRYLVLVVGHWHNDRQHVRASLVKYVTASGERRVNVDEQHDARQAAHTIFNLRDRKHWGEQSFALLEAELKTGRTHQIRVHLSHLGFPIVGDDKYGNFEINRQAARGSYGQRLGRMFLHAWQTRFTHPIDGSLLIFEAPLSPDCDAFLRTLHAGPV